MFKKFIYVGALMLIASAPSMAAKEAPEAASDSGGMVWYRTTCGVEFLDFPMDAFPNYQTFLDYMQTQNERFCGTGGIPETFERPTPSTEPDPHGVKPTPQEKAK